MLGTNPHEVEDEMGIGSWKVMVTFLATGFEQIHPQATLGKRYPLGAWMLAPCRANRCTQHGGSRLPTAPFLEGRIPQNSPPSLRVASL
jgi:hypothetical protein